MVDQIQLETKKGRKKQRTRRKNKKTATKIIIELLKSKRTFLKTEDQMRDILKRKLAKKTKELKEDFSPEEIDLLDEIAQLISIRDERVFDELCHRLRNRLTALGGYSKRINKLSKNILKIIPVISKLDEIRRNAEIICAEVRQAEKRLNNKGKSIIKNKTRKYKETKARLKAKKEGQ
jgi:hypothetical protein